MKFPDIATMAEFIITHKVSQITTNNEERSIEGFIPPQLIKAACKGYGAVTIIIPSSTTLRKPYFSFN